jgi:hypothetical protein
MPASHFGHELTMLPNFSPHVGQVHILSLNVVVYQTPRMSVVQNVLHFQQDYLQTMTIRLR